jgi:hypothetical protein
MCGRVRQTASCFLIFELRPLARRLQDSPGRDVENGKDGRVGKAPRITFAAIDLTDNVQGELSPHVIVVPESSAKKIVCAVEGAGHDAQGDGVIELLAR